MRVRAISGFRAAISVPSDSRRPRVVIRYTDNMVRVVVSVGEGENPSIDICARVIARVRFVEAAPAEECRMRRKGLVVEELPSATSDLPVPRAPLRHANTL